MSKKETYNKWKSYLKSRGVENNVSEQYLSYIKTLLEKNVPIIFNFDHLSLLLGRNKEYLASVVNSPDNHYREFKIKKRSGRFRKITTPYPALLEMQYWIYHNILKTVPLHSSAHGFTYKKSIITNSKIHAGEKHLLKLDLKDFFPSIKNNRIIHIFKELGYPNIIAFYLAQICCFDNCLPQGAPTSPILSNIVARKIDKRLIHLAKKFDLKYTRYADDLTFSGSSISAIFITYVNDIIVDEGFTVNETKTRLYQQKSKRIVTGISVIEKEIKIPRAYKRDLKLELNYILKFGLKSHMLKKKIRKANYLFVILGKVDFWLSVEPKNKYAITARNKLKDLI
jgi:RNA-directed DNA polymerase